MRMTSFRLRIMAQVLPFLLISPGLALAQAPPSRSQGGAAARARSVRHLAVKAGRINKVRHLPMRQEGQAVIITSAEPERIFVPVYNPVVVYGDWPERDYPPVFIPPPPRFVAETIEPG